MSRRTGILGFASALVAALLAVSCASQHAGDSLAFDAAPLFGMVYDGENQPCAGVRLTVDGREGPLSDARGRFVVPGLARGEHRIVARKDGYEDLAVSLAFLARTDVLHLRMTSFDQLLGMAQEALRDTRCDDAEAYLSRAERLDPVDAVLRYLFALHAWKTGQFAAAVGHLNAIVSDGGKQPAVLLFLADLYERNLGDRGKAIESLEAYLELRSDPDVELRLEALREQQRTRMP
jgi:tetratricopeptide (TPR) repeat protein